MSSFEPAPRADAPAGFVPDAANRRERQFRPADAPAADAPAADAPAAEAAPGEPAPAAEPTDVAAAATPAPSPPDLERIFGLPGGNIFHGAMTPGRLWLRRPVPGLGSYRTPVAGLYVCGAGTHPGGGVMGACGRNAAGVVLRET